MKIKNTIYRWYKNILPFKAAVIAVFISVSASVCVSAVSESGRYIINNEMNNMGMDGLAVCAYNTSGNNITDISLYQDISSLYDIAESTPIIVSNINAVFTNGKEINAMAWGINEQAASIVSLELVSGRMINHNDINSNAFVCLVDENVAQKIYSRNNICGKTITVTIGNKVVPLRIIGTVKKGSEILNSFTGNSIPDFIYIPYTTMLNLSSKSAIDQIIFTTDNSDISAEHIKQNLNDISYRYKNKTISLTNLSQYKEQINNITDTAFLSLFAVSCVAVIVGSISVAASVNTAVITKQKDIGIKMSIGASRFDIIKEFLIAAISSCITGIAAALVFIFSTIYLIENILSVTVSIDGLLIVISISAIIVLTTIFSLIPSYKAADMPPIKALNRE